jgi:hypothetical protein
VIGQPLQRRAKVAAPNMHHQRNGVAANGAHVIEPDVFLQIDRNVETIALAPECPSTATAQRSAAESRPDPKNAGAGFDCGSYT